MYYLIGLILVDGIYKAVLLSEGSEYNILLSKSFEYLGEKKYKSLDILNEDDFCRLKLGSYEPKH